MMGNDPAWPPRDGPPGFEGESPPAAPEPFSVPLARPVAVIEGGPLAWARPAPREWTVNPWWAGVELFFLLFVAVATVLAAGAIRHRFPFDDPRWYELIATVLVAVILVGLCFGMVRLDGHPLATIGWRWENLSVDIALGVGATVMTYLLLICGGVVLILLRPDLLEDQTQAQRAIEASLPRMSLSRLVLVMAFVAVWEEIVFRGFLLTRLKAIVRRWWLAIPLGAGLFALMHAYEGPLAMGVVGALGVLLGSLFVWRRSLAPAIVFHLLFNTVGLLALYFGSQTWE